jgi:hypothetical protein
VIHGIVLFDFGLTDWSNATDRLRLTVADLTEDILSARALISRFDAQFSIVGFRIERDLNGIVQRYHPSHQNLLPRNRSDSTRVGGFSCQNTSCSFVRRSRFLRHVNINFKGRGQLRVP